MITRYKVALHGDLLSDIDDCIYIKDIQQVAPKQNIALHKNPIRGGSRIGQKVRRELVVKVLVEIHAPSVEKRKSVCMQIAEWAMAGGDLVINDRPNQILRVVCTTVPVVESALKWTDNVTIVFTAYEVPYWLEKNETVVNDSCLANVNKGVSIVAGGNAGAYFRASVKNSSNSVLNSVYMRIGEKTIWFDGLALAKEQKLVVYYTDEMFLAATANGKQALGKMLAKSSDDLFEQHGNRVFHIKTDANADVTVYARGVFW